MRIRFYLLLYSIAFRTLLLSHLELLFQDIETDAKLNICDLCTLVYIFPSATRIDMTLVTVISRKQASKLK